MLRYYAIAAVLVIVAASVLAATVERRRELRVASERARGTPSPPRREAASTFDPGAVIGDAPWALSAVPECFRQTGETHGSAGFVAAHLPAGARRLAPGTVVVAADCRVSVGAATLAVDRRGERLIVPPRTSVYAAGDGLAVLRAAGGSYDLRVYRRVSGGGP
jgi:hypothetical protein